MSIFVEPEGATELTADDIKGLKFDHIDTRDELNELEGFNILQGQEWLNKYKVTELDDIFNISFVVKLHEKMFGDVWSWAGKFRQVELNIGCEASQIYPNLRNLLDDIKTWIEYEHYSPLELSARIQHGLVKIHPFTNGNGRFSRLFADYVRVELLKMPIMNWANGDLDKQNAERHEYISALRQADSHNFQPFIDYLVERGNS